MVCGVTESTRRDRDRDRQPDPGPGPGPGPGPDPDRQRAAGLRAPGSPISMLSTQAVGGSPAVCRPPPLPAAPRG